MRLILLGAYVPLTMEGNIVGDGVLASCYPFSNHDLAHYGMTPMRLFSDIMEMIFGDNKDFSVYVKATEDLGTWIFPKRLLDREITV